MFGLIDTWLQIISVPGTSVFYIPGLYLSILWTFLQFSWSFGYHFSNLFFFYINVLSNPYNLSTITVLLWSLNFIFSEFWVIEKIINLIILAAINITWKINNYCYNNFLVEEKDIFTTTVINSVEKNSTFKKLEIWHQWCYWWRYHMITELTYVNIFFIFSFIIDRTIFLPNFFRK